MSAPGYRRKSGRGTVDDENAVVSGHRGVRRESRTVATRETLASALVRYNSSPWLRMNARP
jgi:hypothetical protein